MNAVKASHRFCDNNMEKHSDLQLKPSRNSSRDLAWGWEGRYVSDLQGVLTQIGSGAPPPRACPPLCYQRAAGPPPPAP